MGMAASQARLLSITARIHDVEYEAQAINNAKLQLATQSDQVYADYLEALDASTLTINAFNDDGSKSTITANFNNLFSVNRVRPSDGKEYALFNENGYLVVDDEIYNEYISYLRNGHSDPYRFAMQMLGGDEYALENNLTYTGSDNSLGDDDFDILQHKAEEEAYSGSKNSELKSLHEKIEKLLTPEANGNIYDSQNVQEGSEDDYENLMNQYKHILYSKYSKQIYDNLCAQSEDNDFDAEIDSNYDINKFNYYLSIFKQIEACGGCISISNINSYSGPYSEASNDSEWLQNQIQSGRMTISFVNTDKKSGQVSFGATSPSSDTSISYTPTTTIDKSALAKAEAKYEHDLKEIDKIDKKYDMTLSKLETERNALTTEYDSVKKVIEDNIERTFGIFS